MSDSARILDQGYRRYEEERGGVLEAVRAVTLFSLQRVLGIRRGFWPKVLPIATIVISFLPAVVFVGLAALVPEEAADILPDYGEYYGFVSAAILIFVAFVAPELLCTDRRTRMIALYLASPLDRMTYLGAKAIAVAISLSMVTVAPLLLMLVANVVQGVGPDGPGEVLAILWRILVAGLVLAGVQMTLSLAISSFTDRNGIASAGVVLVLLLSAAVANSIVVGADGPEPLLLLDLFNLPFVLIGRIYEVAQEEPAWGDLSTGILVAANVAWTALFAGIVVWRYQRLEVTR